MRAVIIATGESAGMEPLTERRPVPVLPLMDRPFALHMADALVEQGITEVDFILSHLPEQIEALLGDGSRWGMAFRYHLARDERHAHDLLHILDLSGASGPVLLGHADRLPGFGHRWADAIEEGLTPVVFCWKSKPARWKPPAPTAASALAYAGAGLHENARSGTATLIPPQADTIPAIRSWTGWAWLSPGDFADLPRDLDAEKLEQHLLRRADPSEAEWNGNPLGEVSAAVVTVTKPLAYDSCAGLLDAHRRALEGDALAAVIDAPEVEEGVRVGDGARVHPTARLVPPAYVGVGTRIGMGSQVGPNAVIGSDCVLAERSMVENSVVFSGSYVGEALELQDVIVDKNRLVNTRHGANVEVADDFILDSIPNKRFRRKLARTLSRAGGILLLAGLFPLLAGTALALKIFRRGPVLHRREVVRLPVAADATLWKTYDLFSFGPRGSGGFGWRHFFLHFLPGLINVARGDLGFVGMAPRTWSSLAALSGDWKALYGRAKAGLVSEAEVTWEHEPTQDELYAVEAVYSVKAGIRYDLKILSGYFCRLWGLPARV